MFTVIVSFNIVLDTIFFFFFYKEKRGFAHKPAGLSNISFWRTRSLWALVLLAAFLKLHRTTPWSVGQFQLLRPCQNATWKLASRRFTCPSDTLLEKLRQKSGQMSLYIELLRISKRLLARMRQIHWFRFSKRVRRTLFDVNSSRPYGGVSMWSYLEFRRIRKALVPPSWFLPDVQLCMTTYHRLRGSAAIARWTEKL